MADDGAPPACQSVTEFPAPTLTDFDDDVPFEERNFCMERYADLNKVKQVRMHCTACNKHLGLSAQNVNQLKMHPLLRTLICADCLEFYNSGEFSKGEDGSELYCRWCGQGGQVYCCASCPTVFCENCIKRNFGVAKIEAIESIDDWNCFICNPKGLWCHRAALWAARRYCTIKNKLTLNVTQPLKRLQLQREFQLDESPCCKRKNKLATPQSKTPPTPQNKTKLQIKKIPIKEIVTSTSTIEIKKPIKRQASPPFKPKKVSSQSVSHSILANLPNTLSIKTPSSIKKFATSPQTKQARTYSQKITGINKKTLQNATNSYNSFKGIIPNPFAIGQQDYYTNVNDSLNLSLESLTHGLDVSNLHNPNVPAFNDDSVVCTPDFPLLEPMCEVNEDFEEDCTEISVKIDDDVQCLTPKIMPKPLSALTDPVFLPQNLDFNPNNIIQMSEKDVTVNKITGGLKFRVDPATLSTSKMYQLPDGRIFAVNNNPKMPGGYSATIVTLSDQSAQQIARPGLTVRSINNQNDTPVPVENVIPIRTKKQNNQNNAKAKNHSWTKPYVSTPAKNSKEEAPNHQKNNKMKKIEKAVNKPRTSPHPPPKKSSSVEWYSYNLCDAMDLMEYVSKRLNRLKDTHSKLNLQDKSAEEIKEIHYTFDQLLKVSCQRFAEIRKNVTIDYKTWLKEKGATDVFSDEDIDNNTQPTPTSEIELQNPVKSNPVKLNSQKPPINCDEEPIFIDENSEDSFKPAENKSADHSETNHSDDVNPSNENTACEIIDDAESSKEHMSVDENFENIFDSMRFPKNDYITIRRKSDNSIVKDPLGDIIYSVIKKNILDKNKVIDVNLVDDNTQDDLDNDGKINNGDNSNSNLECDRSNSSIKNSEESNNLGEDDQPKEIDDCINNEDDAVKDDDDAIKINDYVEDVKNVDSNEDIDPRQDSNNATIDNGDTFEKSPNHERLNDDNDDDNNDSKAENSNSCTDTEISSKIENAKKSNLSEEDNLSLVKNGDEHGESFSTIDNDIDLNTVDSDKCSKITVADNGKEDSNDCTNTLNDKEADKLNDIVPDNSVTIVD